MRSLNHTLSMTGRARGRSRGRGRAEKSPPAPGGQRQQREAAQEPQVGRGRSRGAPPPAATAAPQARPGSSASKRSAARPNVDPAPINMAGRKKQGEYGQRINALANSFAIEKLPKATRDVTRLELQDKVDTLFGHMKMTKIDNYYYSVDRKIDVRAHKLQIWPGASGGFENYENDIMFTADIEHKVVSTQTVLEFLYELYNKVDRNRFYDIAKKKIIDNSVITLYDNKTYAVNDIDFDKHPTDPFKDGMTFVVYFEKEFDKKVMDMQQPLLRCTHTADDDTKETVYLLPEFCSFLGLSDEARANFSIMKDLSQHTRVGPHARMQNVRDLIMDMNRNQDICTELGANLNVQISKSPVTIGARVLPPEELYTRRDKFSYKPQDADWSRELRGKALISTINLTEWCLVFTQRDQNIASDFVQTLKKVAGPMGISVADPKLVRLNDDSARSYSNTIHETVQPGTQLVVCIAPNNRKDRTDAINKKCCVEKPVPVEIIISRTLSKKQMLMSVVSKIAMRINCKLGGELWATDIPLKDLMVVGIDTCEDLLNRGRTVLGFVSSTNKSLTRYYSRSGSFVAHEELVDQLSIFMTSALKKYQSINGSLPERVIVYRRQERDGILRSIVDHEIPKIIGSFSELSADYKPKMAMFVVRGSTNTKIVVEQRGQMSNPAPGTIVDTVVTKPEWYDFFLVSHAVRQGTVNPTHYNIIHDTSGLKVDHMQRLTYKLTHLYYSWPGTIPVPAPLQYAQDLAWFVGWALHTPADDILCDQLFFLTEGYNPLSDADDEE